MEYLPRDVVYEIFSRIPQLDLIQIKRTCRTLKTHVDKFIEKQPKSEDIIERCMNLHFLQITFIEFKDLFSLEEGSFWFIIGLLPAYILKLTIKHKLAYINENTLTSVVIIENYEKLDIISDITSKGSYRAAEMAKQLKRNDLHSLLACKHNLV